MVDRFFFFKEIKEHTQQITDEEKIFEMGDTPENRRKFQAKHLKQVIGSKRRDAKEQRRDAISSKEAIKGSQKS